MTTETMTTTLTAAQFQVAQRLAAAYGHTWGYIEQPTDLTLDTIHAASVAKRDAEGATEGWQYSITAPTINEDGLVVHTTGTGRTTWMVDKNGVVEICINRPPTGDGDGEVLHATVTPLDSEPWIFVGWCDEVGLYRDVMESYPGADVAAAYHERHVSALVTAIAAALGLDRDQALPPHIAERVARLDKFALPDPAGEFGTNLKRSYYGEQPPAEAHYLKCSDYPFVGFLVVNGEDAAFCESEATATCAVKMLRRETNMSALKAVVYTANGRV